MFGCYYPVFLFYGTITLTLARSKKGLCYIMGKQFSQTQTSQHFKGHPLAMMNHIIYCIYMMQ